MKGESRVSDNICYLFQGITASDVLSGVISSTTMDALFWGKKGAFVVVVFTTNTSFIYPLFSPQETLSSHHAVSQLEAICQPMGFLLPSLSFWCFMSTIATFVYSINWFVRQHPYRYPFHAHMNRLCVVYLALLLYSARQIFHAPGNETYFPKAFSFSWNVFCVQLFKMKRFTYTTAADRRMCVKEGFLILDKFKGIREENKLDSLYLQHTHHKKFLNIFLSWPYMYVCFTSSSQHSCKQNALKKGIFEYIKSGADCISQAAA